MKKKRIITNRQICGAIVLLAMIASLEVFIHLMPKPEPSEAVEPQFDSIRHHKPTRYKRDTIVIRLQPFDPNTADSTALLQLGFKPWQVRNMMKYRAKKGKYRIKEDLKRLYGMTDSMYQALEPYIVLPEKETPKKDSCRADSSIIQYTAKSIKKDTILELNSADTALLQVIRGIGRYTAVRIVNYRHQLGGYASAEQLREIERTEMIEWDSIIPHFIVDTDSIKRISINYASVDRLQRHPYISFTQAEAIYNLRRKQIRLNNINELKQLPFTEEELLRITPYIDFGK